MRFVDAIWIENMNTVLDDNCTLCLPNGERIKLNVGTMRMLFEVQDLAVASPATVSRCGMVYVPTEGLGWRPFIQTWLVTSLNDFPKASKDVIWELFDSLVDPVLQWIRGNGYEYFKSVDINLVTSLARILESILKSHFDVINKVCCAVCK
jgi:dynein heavy chain, axonemal